MNTIIAAAVVLALSGTAVLAQGHAPNPAHAAPYAGMERREIKALSPETVADLRAGRGASLALPAELNGYPGPSHVLEFADALGLRPDQRTRTQALFNEMKHAAIGLGERVIESERKLDLLFARRQATPQALAAAVSEAAVLQGELRAVHLRYHLDMVAVLDPEQVARYAELRGYRRSDR
jgi:hypothetical protein